MDGWMLDGWMLDGWMLDGWMDGWRSRNKASSAELELRLG